MGENLFNLTKYFFNFFVFLERFYSNFCYYFFKKFEKTIKNQNLKKSKTGLNHMLTLRSRFFPALRTNATSSRSSQDGLLFCDERLNWLQNDLRLALHECNVLSHPNECGGKNEDSESCCVSDVCLYF